MLKKILTSKLLRAVFSIALIYFAFRKIDVIHLLGELTLVPKWFVVAMILYNFVASIFGGLRWSVLVIGKPKWRDVWNFTRANYLGGFYSLFFPTAVAGDLLKWLPLLAKYEHLSKTKLASSVLIDRVIGFSAFAVVGFLALLTGKIFNYQFPIILLWLFSGLVLGVVVFYILVFTVDFDKLIGKIPKLHKVLEIIDLLKNENKKRIMICFGISFISEPIWLLSTWFYSLIFHVGISLLQVYIFLPIISLILVLPISVAGFGARENLYLLFFSQLGFPDEKILLVSTFGGILGILISLIGGLLTFIR
jgi:glycosyltransferase 2 family protein